jgi:CheY-like chemotaxis protein
LKFWSLEPNLNSQVPTPTARKDARNFRIRTLLFPVNPVSAAPYRAAGMRLVCQRRGRYGVHQSEAMPGSPTTQAAHSRLIYLVDDEELLLDLAEISLLAEGYAIRRFQDPEAAFKSFTQEPSKPSLLLTDFAMGSMNGLELSTKCKSAHPPLKVLMVSGTAGREVMRQAPGTVDEFMHKPYQPAELARIVRSLLAVA